MRKVLFFLGILDDEDLDWMIAVGRRESVAAGTVLIREGEPITHIYLILDGAFSVSVKTLGGREIVRLFAGEVVGEMSLVEARPPSATVQAVMDSWVLAIPRPQLDA